MAAASTATPAIATPNAWAGGGPQRVVVGDLTGLLLWQPVVAHFRCGVPVKPLWPLQCSPDFDRTAFWTSLYQRLAHLANRINADDHRKIILAIHGRVPMVISDEQRRLQRDNAEQDLTVHSGCTN